MIAQTHIIERNGQLDQEAQKAELLGQDYKRPEVQFLGAKEAYEEVTGKIKGNSPSPNRLFDQFISEKSLNVHKIHSTKKVEEDAAEQLRESMSKVNIDEKDDEEDAEIRKRIQRIMSEYAENN